MTDIIDKVWDEVVGDMHWLKAVIFGEFEDDRPASVMVADMLTTLTVPGLVIVTSGRDLTAVTVRLIKHPEKREESHEWLLVVTCAIPLALPVVGAAIGLAGAGVGAIVGGLAGTELGAFLRAVCILLFSKGAVALEVLIAYLRPLFKGNILGVLRDLKFAKYADAAVNAIKGLVRSLLDICADVRAYLNKLPGIDYVKEALAKLEAFEKGLYGMQSAALSKIPLALGEFDKMLSKVLEDIMPPNPHLATPGVPAHLPEPTTPRIKTPTPAMPNNPLAKIGDEAHGGGSAAKPHASSAKPAATDAKPPANTEPPYRPAEKKPNVHQQNTAASEQGATESANLADLEFSKLSQPGGLMATEGKQVVRADGSLSNPTHPLYKHGPDVTDQYIEDRVATELAAKNRTGLRTAFNDRAQMEDAIAETFNQKQAEIDAWLASGPRAGVPESFEANPGMGNLGRGYQVTTKGGPIMPITQPMPNVNLVLIPDGLGGYLIHTAHPF